MKESGFHDFQPHGALQVTVMRPPDSAHLQPSREGMHSQVGGEGQFLGRSAQA